MNIKITGSGSYIPIQKISNQDFSEHQFLNEDGSKFQYSNEVVAEKFKQITGIEQRRYSQKIMILLILHFLQLKKPSKMQI